MVYYIITILSIFGAHQITKLAVEQILVACSGRVSKDLEKNKESVDEKTYEKLEDENNLQLVALKFKGGSAYIRSIIGLIEISAYVYLFVSEISLEKILPIAGGWMGLKAIGSYQQWSGILYGRPNSQVFLIGSIMNLFWGIVIGWCYIHLK